MKSRSAWVLCIPAALLLLAVAGYPLARTFWYSLTDARLGTMESARAVGLANYRDLLADPDWWRATLNTLIFAAGSVILETILGLAIALLLDARFRGRGLVRAAVLIPWAIPTVVCARIWAWMFNDLNGVFNEWLRAAGVIRAPIAWLGNDRLARFVLILVDAWKSTPFLAILLLAALQAIPASLKDAARVDGVSKTQEFLHVTLPLLKPALAVAVLFRLLDALRVFDLPFVLTSNSRATAMLSTFARQQLVDFQEVGYGSAASMLVFALIALIAVVYLTASRRLAGVRA